MTQNDDIYDTDFVVTNNLEEWKKYFKTEQDPMWVYYFDYDEKEIPKNKKFEF